MTKRKRDIFTVIKSINNWFEASEHNATASEDHEGEVCCHGTIGTSAASVTTNGWTAEGVESGNDTEPPTCTSDSTEPGNRSEVGGHPVACPEAALPLAVVIGYVTGPEYSQGSGSNKGGQANGYKPGNADEGTSEAPGPVAAVEGERDLTIPAFWRILADTGYDVW